MSKDIGMFKGDEWFTRKIFSQKLTFGQKNHIVD